MTIATLRTIRGGTRGANDVDLDVADAQVDDILSRQATSVTGEVIAGQLAWPQVRYPELEISGSAFEVLNVVVNGTRVAVMVGGRTYSQSAFIP
jgi:hypothetical protein